MARFAIRVIGPTLQLSGPFMLWDPARIADGTKSSGGAQVGESFQIRNSPCLGYNSNGSTNWVAGNFLMDNIFDLFIISID